VTSDSPVNQLSSDAPLEEATATVAGEYPVMFAGAGVTADHANQPEASRRFAAVLRLLRLLLLLLLLMLHLAEQVRVAVPQRGQVW